MNKITVLNKLASYHHFPEKTRSGIILSDNEVVFEDRAKQQIIISQVEGCEIKFYLTYYSNETKHFRFEEGYFSKAELLDYSQVLGFDVMPHKYHPNILMGSLGKKNQSYKMSCYGAIITCFEAYYMLVFARRGLTDFEENITYVHGIWAVELSREFKNKLSL